MKKIVILITAYFIFGLVITILQSCLFRYDSWIEDIVFKGALQSPQKDIDYLTEKIDFIIIAGNSTVSYRFSYLQNFEVFSKCYANTKCAKWQNSLDISSFSLTFDRDFVFDSDTIISGKDIFKIESIRKNILIDKEKEECLFITYTMSFAPELAKVLKFESGEL